MKTALLLAAGALAAASPAQDELPDFKGTIDGSIRWLRSTQDAKTGAYGGGVEGTAHVLQALAQSHRKYRRADGPLVANALDFLAAQQSDEGWIADEGADAEARVELTRLAAAALAGYGDPTTVATLSGAVLWLGNQGIEDPYPEAPEYESEREAAIARSIRVVALRDPDGSWEGKGGRVIATARYVSELSHYYAMFKPKAVPGPAKPLPRFGPADAESVDASIVRGARFLIAAAEDGKWGAPGRPDAGITSMVLGALQAVPEPRPADIQEVIDSGLAWLVTLQQEDGSIHQGRLASYVTSSCILALAQAGDTYTDAIVRARDFLIVLQADEGEGYSADHHYYGGIGYGGDERPDLSNLQMALEALSASKLDEDHEAYQRAIRFLQRCQNRSESNDVEVDADGTVMVAGDDGGAAYMPGDSPAGYVELEDGRKIPRSYGSMTYALLKGFIFAGVSKEDPRMQACWKWLCKNYTLDVNPGFEYANDPTASYQGLYYYFHVMAVALDLYGEDEITDGDGRRHAWRTQLAGRLISMQSPLDGSWVNDNAPRWWEGNPVLATSYALLTLDRTKP